MNLAQLKRDIRVGTKLKAIKAVHEKYLGTIREVCRTQSNAFCLRSDVDEKALKYYSHQIKTDSKGTYLESYVDYPTHTCLCDYDGETIKFYRPRLKTADERQRDFEALRSKYGERWYSKNNAEIKRLSSTVYDNERGELCLVYEIVR